MNTPPKNHNPIQNRAPSQPEPVIPDTNLRVIFEATLLLTQYNVAKVTLNAATLDEAIYHAEQLKPNAIEWNPMSESISVASVELVGKTPRKANHD